MTPRCFWSGGGAVVIATLWEENPGTGDLRPVADHQGTIEHFGVWWDRAAVQRVYGPLIAAA